MPQVARRWALAAAATCAVLAARSSQQQAVAETALAVAAGQQQQQQQQEQSLGDWWHEYWSRQPFPSGYTQSSITLLACLMTTIIFLIVVGNLLVCIAIFTEKSLKPTQNWFIASLAVSDMMLGLIVMPFSLARELMGFWMFGPLWCDIHEAMDVLLSTASINTLCLISLDRYWSITQAVSYLKKRTPRRCAFMIAFVWFFSAAVSLPPLFGWKKPSPEVPALTSQPNSTSALSGGGGGGGEQSTALRVEPRGPESASPAAPNSQEELEEPGAYEQAEAERASGSDDAELRVEQKKRRRRGREQTLAVHEQHHLLERAGQLAEARPNSMLLAGQQAQAASQQQQQQQQQLEALQEYPQCQLSDDVGYVLYSALGSFYIPCAVMVFTYIKIFLAARSRARRTINKQSARSQALASAGAKRSAAGLQSGGQPMGRRTVAGSAGAQPALAPNPAKLAELAPFEAKSLALSELGNKPQPLMKAGKLVVVERRKSQAVPSAQAGPASAPGEAGKRLSAQQECTLVTSEAKLASLSVLEPEVPKPLVKQQQQQQQHKQACIEQSSLITVMSASMSELPVTRFQFKQDTRAGSPQMPSSASASAASREHDNLKAAAFLRAISQVSCQDSDQLAAAADEVLSSASPAPAPNDHQLESGKAGDNECVQNATNNCTSETCFMTIEEDSDNLDTQTGRTIMIIADSARPGAVRPERDQHSPLCNRASCLRRARRARKGAGSAGCGSSVTIDVDESSDDESEEVDEDDDDDDDDEDDEEDDEGPEEVNDDEEDHELISECNGYSNASCTFDQFDECLNADSCAMHCRECMAIDELASLQGDDDCHLSGCSPIDSPARIGPPLEMEAGKRRASRQATLSEQCKLALTSSKVPSHVDCQEEAVHSTDSGHGVLDATTGTSPQSHHAHAHPHLHQHHHHHSHNHHHHHHSHHQHQHKQHAKPAESTRRASTAPPPHAKTELGAGQDKSEHQAQAEVQQQQAQSRKKSSIGMRLARLGSSVPPLSSQNGGLLALAASQHREQVTGGGATRNLKALRQNFFHKLNQLTAKSAAKQKRQKRVKSEGKSSTHSSYGSSYEPSVDYATTSNVHSTVDPCKHETTLANSPVLHLKTKDDYEPQTSAETTTRDAQSGATSNDQQAASGFNLAPASQSPCPANSQSTATDPRPRLEHSKRTSEQSTNQLGMQTREPTKDQVIHTEADRAGQRRESSAIKRNRMHLDERAGKEQPGGLALIDQGVPNHEPISSGKRPSCAPASRNQPLLAHNATLSSSGASGRATLNSAHSKQPSGSNHTSAGHSRAYLASDNERHKRKVAKARERRATLILGLIMAAFICSWLPFFTFYVTRALCQVCRDYMSARFESFVFWMGYCNSAINPIIYTIFNRDFRKAFRKILFKCL